VTKDEVWCAARTLLDERQGRGTPIQDELDDFAIAKRQCHPPPLGAGERELGERDCAVPSARRNPQPVGAQRDERFWIAGREEQRDPCRDSKRRHEQRPHREEPECRSLRLRIPRALGGSIRGVDDARLTVQPERDGGGDAHGERKRGRRPADARLLEGGADPSRRLHGHGERIEEVCGFAFVPQQDLRDGSVGAVDDPNGAAPVRCREPGRAADPIAPDGNQRNRSRRAADAADRQRVACHDDPPVARAGW